MVQALLFVKLKTKLVLYQVNKYTSYYPDLFMVSTDCCQTGRITTTRSTSQTGTYWYHDEYTIF